MSPPVNANTSVSVGAIVQVFFACRIYVLKPGWVGRCLSAFIVLTALMQSISSIAFAIQVWLAGSAACDVAITLAMTHILRSAKFRVSFDRTNRLLDKLISRSIQSGAYTSLFAIVELVLFLTQSQNFLHVSIYSNVLMANLNARSRTTAVSEINTNPTFTSSNYHLQTLRHVQGPDIDSKPSNFRTPV
ncbi:hypothetical protein C0995_009769 [Termitomyces sp. Mi166|nr:hypothetical protein C0995_009769 [Termitomyces sp. Mi166\